MSISKIMGQTGRLTILVVLLCSMLSGLHVTPASALTGSDFNAARIMDDQIFFDNTRMSASDIQNFLNSKVPVCDTNGTQMRGNMTRAAYSAQFGVSTPFICLKGYSENIPAKSADQFCAGAISAATLSAAQIIKAVSDACVVSPMVLITLLQKEQSLITDDWPWPVEYQRATGFGCPDTAACDQTYTGFFNQVYYGARQFRRYAAQPQLFGYGAGRSNFIQYNPNSSCSGSQVVISGQATAGLYNYTPYQPNSAALANLYGTGDGCSAYGNRNFWRIYSDWFGSTVTGRCSFDPPGQFIASVDWRKQKKNLDWAAVTIYSGSGTGCIESHTWNQGFGSWYQNAASNFPAINPADGSIHYADLDGDGKDEPILVGLDHTGSGMVEFHVWNTTMNQWVVHAASNLPTSQLSNVAIAFADLNGDGRDEPIAMTYKDSGSGMVEFHFWNSGVATWSRHEVTNLPVIDPSKMVISFGDLNGDGRDEAIAVGVSNTGSGMVEFHVWNQYLNQWAAHYATNLPTADFNSNDESISFADIDGDGKDEAVLVQRQHTGSGRIEFHAWNPGFTSWKGHWASNLSAFQ